MARKKPRVRFPENPYHITFRGEIHPPASRMTLDRPIEVKFADTELNYSVIIFIGVMNCRLDVDCYVSSLFGNYMLELLVRAGDAARAVVDLMAFKKGLGVTVVFDHWIDHERRHRSLLFADPALPSLCTSLNSDAIASDMLQLVMSDVGIFLALSDLIMANTLPHQAPASCGRTVEGIRHMIAGKGTDAKKAWPVMNRALRLEKSFMDVIINNAMQHRHGNRTYVSGPDSQTIVHRSWQIMDRYFHLRLRNLTELPEAEFPLLS